MKIRMNSTHKLGTGRTLVGGQVYDSKDKILEGVSIKTLIKDGLAVESDQPDTPGEPDVTEGLNPEQLAKMKEDQLEAGGDEEEIEEEQEHEEEDPVTREKRKVKKKVKVKRKKSRG